MGGISCTLSISRSTSRRGVTILFYSWGNQGTKKSRTLPMTTQLGDSGLPHTTTWVESQGMRHGMTSPSPRPLQGSLRPCQGRKEEGTESQEEPTKHIQPSNHRLWREIEISFLLTGHLGPAPSFQRLFPVCDLVQRKECFPQNPHAVPKAFQRPHKSW